MKLSIEDVPENISDVAGAQIDQIQICPNRNIVNNTQQLGDATSQGVDNAQILLDLLAECNKMLTEVVRQGIGELQRCGEMNDREKWTKQWDEFLHQVWEGIHYESKRH